MVSIVAIVEGHGEVQAVPILLRRITELSDPSIALDIPQPIRVPHTRLLRQSELERTVELAALQGGRDGRVLILLDADDECPAILGPDLLRRAMNARSDRRIVVVLAKREFEAWFLASPESFRGRRGIREDVTAPPDPESIRDAKGWLTSRMGSARSYRETLDQPALTAVLDFEQARRRAASFQKLCRDVESLIR